MFELASAPPVKDALGLRDQSVEDTKAFIRAVIAEERRGESLSRVILDEAGEVVGVTTLMYFRVSGTAAILARGLGMNIGDWDTTWNPSKRF